jgi:tetratricopeptide (TPR) repeat protein
MNQWAILLQSTDLSASDKEILNRFEKDPTGRGFLPVGDILYKKGFVDEAIELLLEGVNRHSKYSVARVILGRYLYEKGMFVTSWKILTDSKVSLSDNLLAQHILYRLAIILGEEQEARNLFTHMKSQNLIDEDISHLSKKIQVEGIDQVKSELLANYNKDEIELPEEGVKLVVKGAESGVKKSLEATNDYSEFGGFHVVPLKEIFSPAETSAEDVDVKGIELDSTTLAEIYEKQHHYSKALEIYRRLLKISPSSDLIRRKITELSRKNRDLESGNLNLSPDVVDSMEDSKAIDDKIDLLESMLDNLGKK